jgi:hypothetical protein
MMVHTPGILSTPNTTSVTSMTNHHRVLILLLVGVVFSSPVHLECRGVLMENVFHVENTDTGHPFILNGNHFSLVRDLQLQNPQLEIWVDRRGYF